MTYAEKLRDPRWQKKRLKILERDKWTCLACGSTKKTLEVHHAKYAGEDPWDTPDGFLVTLCGACHGQEHGKEPSSAYGFARVIADASLAAIRTAIQEGRPVLPATGEASHGR
jgi:5-methylcytosine-specific restriction endonuclease McrA